MKKFITYIILTFIIVDIVDSKYLNNYIYNLFNNTYSNKKYNIVINEKILNSNKYMYKQYGNKVHSTNNFYPKNENELFDVYYTMLNNGLDDFSYYCDKSYHNCLDDIKKISNNEDNFTYLNQVIHPYHSFKSINSKYNSSTKRVDVTIERKYSDEDISKIENKLNEIINNLNINDYNSVNDKIRVFHDYLANTNIYDKKKESKTSPYNSDTAIGTLFEGYSICSGYSDTMAIFLNKLGLENVKIMTDKHVWNAVKFNDSWYHIDLTWDDPIVSNGSNIITHDFLLITTDQLLIKDTSEHSFNKELYDFIN